MRALNKPIIIGCPQKIIIEGKFSGKFTFNDRNFRHKREYYFSSLFFYFYFYFCTRNIVCNN